jgi:hypothetical protein
VFNKKDVIKNIDVAQLDLVMVSTLINKQFIEELDFRIPKIKCLLGYIDDLKVMLINAQAVIGVLSEKVLLSNDDFILNADEEMQLLQEFISAINEIYPSLLPLYQTK